LFFDNTSKSVRKWLDGYHGSAVNTCLFTKHMLRSGEQTSAKKWLVDRLISLGLTEREAEVLTWIARGKGNYEIGVILGARTRTIGKHVERILTKLHVENRTAAAAIVFTVCSQLFDLF
jgi:DNA-binding CsgD family transcriptional regulator